MKKILLSLLAILAVLVIAVAALFFRPDLSREELSEYINEESEFLDLPMGANVHYRDEGNPDGPVIVLIHGGFGSLHNWEFWVPYLEQGYRIITMDLPGHGLTGRVKDDFYPRPAAVRLVEELLAELKVDRFTIGGHSYGGGIALEYALRHPEQIDALILVGSEGVPPEGGYPVEDTFFEEYATQDEALSDKSLSFGEVLLTKFSSPWVVEEALKGIFGDPSQVTPEMARWYGRITRHQGNRYAQVLGFRQAAAFTNSKEDLAPRMDEITQPVLLLFGDKDILTPPEVAERFHQLLPNSTLKMYQGVGHMTQMEVTEQTAQDVLSFLQTEVSDQITSDKKTPLQIKSLKLGRIPTEIQTEGTILEFAQYPEEDIISGTSDVVIHHLFSGQIDVVSTKIRPLRVRHHEPFPYDEILVVLEGEIRILEKGATEFRVFKQGDIVWVPRGAEAVDEEFVPGESGYYRSMVIVPMPEVLAGEDAPPANDAALAERSARTVLISTELPTEGAIAAPPYPADKIIAGESETTIYHLFTGQLDVIASRVKPITLGPGELTIFDKAFYITEGQLILQLEGESEPEVYSTGDFVWVPKGMNVVQAEVTGGESGYYRTVEFSPMFLKDGELVMPADRKQ